jgi:hypothetical protein
LHLDQEFLELFFSHSVLTPAQLSHSLNHVVKICGNLSIESFRASLCFPLLVDPFPMSLIQERIGYTIQNSDNVLIELDVGISTPFTVSFFWTHTFLHFVRG